MLPRFIDAETIHESFRPRDAVAILRRVLRDGFDPADDSQRSALPTAHGEMLLMPSSSSTAFGIKLLSVAPADFEADVPRIQGCYVLFDGTTLSPSAFIDGIAVTNLRTPAVSIACILDLIAHEETPLEVVIMGTGVQADAHAKTLRDTLEDIRPVNLTFIGRSAPADDRSWYESGSPEAQSALSAAELVITATTASEPILDDAALRDDAIVVAVGSHSPSQRELPSALMSRAQVIVEDRETTLREGGDVVLAVDEGALSPTDVVSFADVVTGAVSLERNRPIVFKFTGMPWEDLAVAEAIASAVGA